jgi:putative membrane protein
MIGRLLAWWVLTTVALGVAVVLIGSVTVTGFAGLAVAGLVLALLNLFLKPILTILGAPLHIMTLGLSLFLVNMAIIALTAYFVDALEVGGFVSVLEVTAVVWAAGAALQLALGSS